MDPFTIALAAFNILDGKDKQRRQGILDKAEAKWSGYKGYQPFEGTANTGLGSVIQQVGWQRALEKAAQKDAQQGKVLEKDETAVAKEFANPPTADVQAGNLPEGYSEKMEGDDNIDTSTYDIGGELTDEQNQYFKMLRANQRLG